MSQWLGQTGMCRERQALESRRSSGPAAATPAAATGADVVPTDIFEALRFEAGHIGQEIWEQSNRLAVLFRPTTFSRKTKTNAEP